MNQKQLNILITHINQEYAYERKIKNTIKFYCLIICFILLTIIIIYYQVTLIKYKIIYNNQHNLIIEQKLLELMLIYLNIILLLALKKTVKVIVKYSKLY